MQPIKTNLWPFSLPLPYPHQSFNLIPANCACHSSPKINRHRATGPISSPIDISFEADGPPWVTSVRRFSSGRVDTSNPSFSRRDDDKAGGGGGGHGPASGGGIWDAGKLIYLRGRPDIRFVELRFKSACRRSSVSERRGEERRENERGATRWNESA